MNEWMYGCIDRQMDGQLHTSQNKHNAKKSCKESAVIFLEEHSPCCLHRPTSKKIVIIS